MKQREKSTTLQKHDINNSILRFIHDFKQKFNVKLDVIKKYRKNIYMHHVFVPQDFQHLILDSLKPAVVC